MVKFKVLMIVVSLLLTLHADVVIDKNIEFINLSRNASVYYDDNRSLQAKEIVTGKHDHLFSINDADSVSAGYYQGAVWIDLLVRNDFDATYEAVLDLPIPWINRIDLFVRQNETISHHRFGIAYPYADRGMHTRGFSLPLTIPPDQNVRLLLRAQGAHALILAPRLFSKKTFERNRSQANTFSGVLMGVIVVAMLFSFVLFLSLGDRVFVYYSLFMGALLLVMGSYYGFNYRYFWPNSPHFNDVMTSASISLFTFAGLLFTRRFLQTKKYMPRADGILRIFMAIFIILFGLNFVVEERMPVTSLSILLLSANAIVIIWISVAAFLKKIPGSMPFVLAWTLSNVVAIFTSMMVEGTMAYSDVLYHFSGFTNIIDIILFAHALSERTTALQKANFELIEQNKQLEKLSILDGLTGIYNRRYFDDFSASMWCAGSNDRCPLSIIMIDIDFFKQYNDTYGHQLGDECLILLAQTMRQTLSRPTDLLARYGGEEFVVLLDGDEEEARSVAHRIHQAVIELARPHSVSPMRIVTVSMGIASTIPTLDQTVEMLIAKADKALYRSKGEGRNRFTLAD